MSRSTRRKYNVVVLGASGVGKTAVLNRYIDGSLKFDSPSLVPTIGRDYKGTVEMEMERTPVEVALWDLSGQERFRGIIKKQLEQCDGAVIMYDANDRDTFDRVRFWYRELMSAARESVTVMLVANKTEVENEEDRVRSYEGAALARTIAPYCGYHEVSAKTGSNVNEIFQRLTEAIYRGDEQPNSDLTLSQRLMKRFCQSCL